MAQVDWSMMTLPCVWDSIPEVRERMRDTQQLVARGHGEATTGVCAKTIANARMNEKVLAPVLSRMCENDMKLPAIDNLMEDVNDFYDKCKASKENMVVYNTTWSLRSLLQIVKARIYKTKPPQDSVSL